MRLNPVSPHQDACRQAIAHGCAVPSTWMRAFTDPIGLSFIRLTTLYTLPSTGNANLSGCSIIAKCNDIVSSDRKTRSFRTAQVALAACQSLCHSISYIDYLCSQCPEQVDTFRYYHVMNRGRARQAIFHNSEYYSAFLKTLEEAYSRFDAEIHAYCLMDNHYHLLIGTPRANLDRIMRHINGRNSEDRRR